MGKKKQHPQQIKSGSSSSSEQIESQSSVGKKKAKCINKKEKRSKRDTTKEQKAKKITHRTLSGARVGRPLQASQVLDALPDPTSDIQEQIFIHLQKCGLPHGLVMRPDDRKFLNTEPNKKVTWKDDHNWQKNTQQKLIKGNGKIMFSIRNCCQKFNSLTEDELIHTFLNIGSIVADECTLEIYQLLAQVLDSIRLGESENHQRVRCKRLLDSFIFLSIKFTNLYRKHWITTSRFKKDDIQKSFANMFSEMVQSFKFLLQNPIDLKRYLEDDEQMDRQLLQIMQAYKPIQTD